MSPRPWQPTQRNEAEDEEADEDDVEVGAVRGRVEVTEADRGEGDEGEVDRVGVGPVLHVGQISWTGLC